MKTLTQPKVLIVEDDPQIRQIYEFKLGNSGFFIRTAANGEVGLAEAKDFTPDLILLDLRMPIMNGDEMLARLRAEDWGADVRVIILTNISKDEAPRSLGLLGVDRYVVKAHYTPSQVVEIVREVLAGA